MSAPLLRVRRSPPPPASPGARRRPRRPSAPPASPEGVLRPPLWRAGGRRPVRRRTVAPAQALPQPRGHRPDGQSPGPAPRSRREGPALTTAPLAGAWSSLGLRARISGSPHPAAQGSLRIPPSCPRPRPSRSGHPPRARRAVATHARTHAPRPSLPAPPSAFFRACAGGEDGTLSGRPGDGPSDPWRAEAWKCSAPPRAWKGPGTGLRAQSPASFHSTLRGRSGARGEAAPGPSHRAGRADDPAARPRSPVGFRARSGGDSRGQAARLSGQEDRTQERRRPLSRPPPPPRARRAAGGAEQARARASFPRGRPEVPREPVARLPWGRGGSGDAGGGALTDVLLRCWALAPGN